MYAEVRKYLLQTWNKEIWNIYIYIYVLNIDMIIMIY